MSKIFYCPKLVDDECECTQSDPSSDNESIGSVEDFIVPDHEIEFCSDEDRAEDEFVFKDKIKSTIKFELN